jgi:hypothetical protein
MSGAEPPDRSDGLPRARQPLLGKLDLVLLRRRIVLRHKARLLDDREIVRGRLGRLKVSRAEGGQSGDHDDADRHDDRADELAARDLLQRADAKAGAGHDTFIAKELDEFRVAEA